jgi:hypothetical protein
VVTVRLNATRPGDGLVLVAGANDGADNLGIPVVSSISDNGTTHATYAKAVGKTIPAGESVDLETWYASNIPAGITSITVTFTAPSPAQVGSAWVGEYSGLAASGMLDRVSAQSSTGSTHSSGATPATSQTNELVVAAYADGGWNTSITAPAGWSSRCRGGNQTFDQLASADSNAASIGAQSASFTTSGTPIGAAEIVTFRHA